MKGEAQIVADDASDPLSLVNEYEGVVQVCCWLLHYVMSQRCAVRPPVQ